MFFRKKTRKSRAATLVEYGLVVAGVSLISAAAVSIFGHKVNDLIAATAAILPGAHPDDNNAIVSGKLIETTDSPNGISIDAVEIATNGAGANRLSTNVLGNSFGGGATGAGFGGLVIEAEDN